MHELCKDEKRLVDMKTTLTMFHDWIISHKISHVMFLRCYIAYYIVFYTVSTVTSTYVHLCNRDEMVLDRIAFSFSALLSYTTSIK